MRRQVIGSIAPLRGGARGWGWYHLAVKKLNAPKAATQSYDYAVPTPETPRPRAFLNVQIGNNNETEKIVFEVASDIVPKTADNFLQLIQSGQYKNSPFHLIQKNQYVTGGDITSGNGKGGVSAFGSRFEDENFALRYTEPGVVGMANAGVNTNGSQFFITMKPMPHLNGRNVAFGKIVDGMDVVKKIENVYCVKGKPLTDIKVVDCGLFFACKMIQEEEEEWEELNAIVKQVKDGDIDRGLERLCIIAFDDDSTKRQWAQDTILDVITLNERWPMAPGIAENFPLSCAFNEQVETIKRNVFKLLKASDIEMTENKMIQLQQLIADQIENREIFIEMVEILLEYRHVHSMTPYFEIRVLENMNFFLLQTRFNLWNQFPSFWELQVTEWLTQAHVNPLISIDRLLFAGDLMNDLPDFKLRYNAAPHLHLVAIHVCQRLLQQFPTLRTLEVIQTLASFTSEALLLSNVSCRLHTLCKMMRSSTIGWWQVAQHRNAFLVACEQLFSNPDNDFALDVVVLILSCQCPHTEEQLRPFMKSLISDLKASKPATNTPVFQWLQANRINAGTYFAATATTICIWIRVHPHCFEDGIESMQYLLRLPPPNGLDKRTYQVSVLSIYLNTLGEVLEKLQIRAVLIEITRIMHLDPEICLPLDWQQHVLERLTMDK